MQRCADGRAGGSVIGKELLPLLEEAGKVTAVAAREGEYPISACRVHGHGVGESDHDRCAIWFVCSELLELALDRRLDAIQPRNVIGRSCLAAAHALPDSWASRVRSR